MAQWHGRRASFARAGQRHRRFYRTRYRRSPPEISTAAFRYRRAFNGRHERGGRSLRFGQNVSAAGREERAGHEEIGGLSPPVHGGGKETLRRKSGAGT